MKKGTLILLVIFLLLVAVFIANTADSEEAWVICQPDSFVYLRTRPAFGSGIAAFLEAGEKVETDGRQRGKWIHVLFECEDGEGWVFGGYLTDSEPEFYPDGIAATTDVGNVRARRYAGGPVRKNLKKGTELTVYSVSDSWCITDQGFVKTNCLLFDGGDIE